jgi:hypothetical protein
MTYVHRPGKVQRVTLLLLFFDYFTIQIIPIYRDVKIIQKGT